MATRFASVASVASVASAASATSVAFFLTHHGGPVADCSKQNTENVLTKWYNLACLILIHLLTRWMALKLTSTYPIFAPVRESIIAILVNSHLPLDIVAIHSAAACLVTIPAEGHGLLDADGIFIKVPGLVFCRVRILVTPQDIRLIVSRDIQRAAMLMSCTAANSEEAVRIGEVISLENAVLRVASGTWSLGNGG